MLYFLPTSPSSSFFLLLHLFLLLLFPRCRVQGDPSPGFPHFRPHHPGYPEHGAAIRPAPLLFKTQNNTELKAQVGTTAVLHCVAYHVGDNTVSWIRRRDYHLLTVGSLTYSSDQRFQIRYVKQENDWQLHIQYVQVRDDGVYECQVSSHPPVSLLSTLHVTEATSEVLGGPEKYVRVGSSLRLVCVLKNNTQPPEYVFWYHGALMINFHATREVRVEQNGGVSTLYLNQVRASDSGNYTCSPSKARPAHILIHVLKGGETPAAIHSGASGCRERSYGSLSPTFALLLVLLQFITLPATSPYVLLSQPSLHSQCDSKTAKRGPRTESKARGRGGGRGDEGCTLPLSQALISTSGRDSKHISKNTKDKIAS